MRWLLPGLLSGASLILGAAIVYEAAAPLDPVTVETPHPAARHTPLNPPAAYTPPPIELFADIDSRPLFSSPRKPLQDLAQAGSAAAASSDFVLVGVIMGTERAVALLRNKSSSATTSAAVGDLVNGWRVARIDATAVTLHGSGGDFVVPLDGPANAPPSAALPEAPAPAAPISPPQPTQPPSQLPAQATAVITPAKPALPAHRSGGTIAPEALRGAPIDPKTGEPTL